MVKDEEKFMQAKEEKTERGMNNSVSDNKAGYDVSDYLIKRQSYFEDILTLMPSMYSGEELRESLKVIPAYDNSIRFKSVSERLIALNDLYNIYLPSQMSIEIYNKLYLSCIRILGKKKDKIMVQQRNFNAKCIKNNVAPSYQGICGGSDSFSIIGCSGIGKSSAISRAVNLFNGNKVIEVENPFCKIIPCIFIQCPFDCSVKSMLLSILMSIDDVIATHYYDMAVKARATTDMLIASVSQSLINHVCLLIIDEIQHVIFNRQGKSLIGCLTMLINNCGISVCMVGTNEAEIFLSGVDYLARRSLGLKYDKCAYDDYFREFCNLLFSYQYVKNESIINDSIILWLYEHSGGILANVVSILSSAQEISILNGTEILDMASLELAYQQRMGMLHEHIRPSISIKGNSNTKKNNSVSVKKNISNDDVETENAYSPALSPADKSDNTDWTFIELAEQAKKEHIDILKLLNGKINITEIVV